MTTMTMKNASLLILCLGGFYVNVAHAFMVHHRHHCSIGINHCHDATYTHSLGPLFYKSSGPNDGRLSQPFETTADEDNDLSTQQPLSTTTRSPPPRRRSFLHSLDRFLTLLQDTELHLKKHTFLSGNFAPVSEEHVRVPVKVVEGELPATLDGAFCRNGPNPIAEVQKKRYHWVSIFISFHSDMFT